MANFCKIFQPVGCGTLVHVVRVDGVRLCLWTPATSEFIVHLPNYILVWRAMVGWCWQGKTEELREKTCPSTILSTTNPTWTDLSLCHERPEPWHSQPVAHLILNPGEVAWGMIRPHSVLFYYSSYIFYVVACIFNIPLPHHSHV
jgi:hypothetical protein